MKYCSKCKDFTDDFNKNKSKPDGLATECRKCVRKYAEEYRQRQGHQEKNIEYQKEYRVENKEVLDEKKKVYTENNKIAHIERRQRWYQKNSDKVKQKIYSYKKEHKDQYRLYANKRVALKKTTVVEDFTFNDIIEKYGDKCVYCGGNFDHIDHYIPLSKGGGHTLKNVRPSCESCNLTKNNKMPEDFLKMKREAL